MNRITDANNIYEAGTKSMQSSKFKYGTQLYEINHLVETAKLQRELSEGTYKPKEGIKFQISERGKQRYITSNTMADKTVNHILCDEIITPEITQKLIHDNGASQTGKGVSFSRRRFEEHMHKYYNEHGRNEGWILLIDFSGYYANVLHGECKDAIKNMISPTLNEEEKELTLRIIDNIFESFEMDVSHMPDEDIESLYKSKVDPQMNDKVPKELLTGEKMLKKGVDIGNQISQSVGIVYPYRIDNFIKIVRGCKYYGRYTDDSYIIHESKEFLTQILKEIKKIANEYGIIINEKKTRIVKLSSFFRYLQIGYQLTDTGKLIRKINPKNVTRERRKLKAYKRQFDKGTIDYETVENSFKSWIGANWRLMSREQIKNMSRLYYKLFGKRVTWKKNKRLNWLMEHA